jgi:MFS family permease
MGASLLGLAGLDPARQLGLVTALLVTHAFAAATQDVAIDALAVGAVPPGERGSVNGAMQAGMLLGRALGGGAALLVAERWGWRAAIVLLVAVIWATLPLALLARRRDDAGAPMVERLGARLGTFRRTFAAALARRATWLGLAFALTAGAAFEATGALAGPYLADRGLSAKTIGWFFGLAVLAAMAAGALAGGRWVDRSGRGRPLVASLLGFVAAVLLLAAFEASGSRDAVALLGALGAMYLAIGAFTAASYALFMDLTDPGLGGTQFSAFMSATNGCEAWAAWLAGGLASASGYPVAFVVASCVSLASLVLVGPLLARRPLEPSGLSPEQSVAGGLSIRG